MLQGDHSEDAFAELVRQHATSGVSGVVPKFLDAQHEKVELGLHKRATLFTRRHIVKGSSRQLPYLALNEYFCMQVAAQILPAAKTEISRDAQVLIVHRFDVDKSGQLHWGMEDFCALLGLRPAAKYDPTWERIAKAVRDHVLVAFEDIKNLKGWLKAFKRVPARFLIFSSKIGTNSLFFDINIK